ncbi:glyoxal oxidase N-terminus-domain-containing protein [Mortierella sp. GBAus27b]|nr:glyoxal oxidase N-terminus-domain-containing protein [Mortierella sp. GBAus27b]
MANGSALLRVSTASTRPPSSTRNSNSSSSCSSSSSCRSSTSSFDSQRISPATSRFPLLVSTDSPQRNLPYSTSSRPISLRQCSLTAVLATALIAASWLPHFPSGSDAAVSESSAGNGFQQGSGASVGGQWDLIGHSGVSAMHAVLRPLSDNILFLERVQASTVARAQGTSENGNGGDTFAWSTEFSATDGTWRSLDVKSNTFCSAGGYLPDGTVVSVAGGQPSDEVQQGYDGIRLYKPCNGTQCDWQQNFDVHLQEKRWYPTVEALASGDLFILGGSNHAASINNEHINVPNFELFPPLPGRQKTIDFPFLVETLPNNLYPIVHLLPDKNLFILASTKAIILSTSTWKIIQRLPDIPGPPRNYPLTGGSVLLPLTPENNYEPEILICGGATEFSSQGKGVTSCGRIAPLSKNPTWEMEDMPFGRMMPDMAHLADGSIAILNGADTGTAGFDRAWDPVLHPVQYLPNEKPGHRFRVWNPSVIARMYHSVAFLLPDASLLVAGSNPNGKPVEYGEGPFPTEYRVEKFSPPYLFPQGDFIPADDGEIAAWPTKIHYGETFDISLKWYNKYPETIRVALIQPGFITHSTHMSQRYVGLEIVQCGPKIEAAAMFNDSEDKSRVAEAGLLRVKAPASNGLAPPSHYMLAVVLDGVPVIEAKWVQLSA